MQCADLVGDRSHRHMIRFSFRSFLLKQHLQSWITACCGSCRQPDRTPEMSRTLFGNMGAFACEFTTLCHARIDTRIGDQRFGIFEAADVAYLTEQSSSENLPDALDGDGLIWNCIDVNKYFSVKLFLLCFKISNLSRK